MTPMRLQEIKILERYSYSVPLNMVRELINEVERLKEGKFTDAEIHHLCHNLSETVPVCEFAKGCADYQRQVYGTSPDQEDAERYRFLRNHEGELSTPYTGWDTWRTPEELDDLIDMLKEQRNGCQEPKENDVS